MDATPEAGEVEVRFTAANNGGTGSLRGSAVVRTTSHDPWVSSCVADALEDVRFSFPPGRGEATATHVFAFRPEDGGIRRVR